MPTYNFKTICVVPPAKDFIDIILSKTQRQTPTVVRKGFKITRIRSFYIRKVKYTQLNYHEKLTQIVEEFPRLEDIHPFYADLCNVLYSRSHYKLALGHLNVARKLIDGIGKDYVKLLKFGDSLYRCKQLKRAALGRMCTVLKKLDASLKYLEQVRQHLSRLPSIDPNTRTLLITGYPNVGKSSFINKISRANVDVQPYAFTTKSLFVGHTMFQYNEWQVIDTPGILDHPLEDRGTIEMQAITALAHLHSTVLFFIDISEQCGYSIKKQVALYHSIKPLFANKPLLIVANKIDLRKLADVPADDRALLEEIRKERDTSIIEMSNATDEGIVSVKQTACELLLADRYNRKIKGKRLESVINRIQIAKPTPRDEKKRESSIPDTVKEEKKLKKKSAAGTRTEDADDVEMKKPRRKTEREIELENGGPGIYNIDLRKFYRLENADWNNDIVPEFMDGLNVADYVDVDVEKRLLDLEAEEEKQCAEYQEMIAMREDPDLLEDDEKDLHAWIKRRLKLIKGEKKTNNRPQVPRKFKNKIDLDDTEKKFSERGLSTDKLRSRSKSLAKGTKRKGRSRSVPGGTSVAPDGKLRSTSRSKSRARTPSIGPGTGFSTMQQKKKAARLAKKVQAPWIQDARQGESDRRYGDKKPKHLLSGKRGIGKTDRR